MLGEVLQAAKDINCEKFTQCLQTAIVVAHENFQRHKECCLRQRVLLDKTEASSV